jgi:hypothetical protein
MLYHVPDREAALDEIARVLAPDGTLYAATNGEAHMGELLSLVEAYSGEAVESASAAAFSLENGEAQLRRSFDEVTLRRYPNDLRVTAVEPVVAYALSRPELDESGAEPFARLVEERMEDGVFQITKDTGLFVARSPRSR